MKNGIKVLNVQMQGIVVGRLFFGNDRRVRFEYDLEWLKIGFSISPFYLPLKSGVFVAKHEPFDGLFGVFADSMPDGWGNLLLDRFLKSKGVSLQALTVLDRLAFVGNNGMGALNYIPDQSFISSGELPNINKIADQVAEILSEQADIPTVESLLAQTGSSGGARPKVLIKHEEHTWMVKFPSTNDSKDIGKHEFFYSQFPFHIHLI